MGSRFYICSRVYMSVPNGQFIPPLLCLSWQPYVCFLSLGVCFLNKFIFIIFFFLDSTYKRYRVIFVFLWFISPSMSFRMFTSFVCLSILLLLLITTISVFVHTCVHTRMCVFSFNRVRVVLVPPWQHIILLLCNFYPLQNQVCVTELVPTAT